MIIHNIYNDFKSPALIVYYWLKDNRTQYRAYRQRLKGTDKEPLTEQEDLIIALLREIQYGQEKRLSAIYQKPTTG